MAAPKGNINAFKHGFYGRHLSPAQIKGLRSRIVKRKGLENELIALRAAIDNVLSAMSDKDWSDRDNQAAISNIIAGASAIGLLSVRIKLLEGKEPETQTAIMEAVQRINEELTNLYDQS